MRPQPERRAGVNNRQHGPPHSWYEWFYKCHGPVPFRQQEAVTALHTWSYGDAKAGRESPRNCLELNCGAAGGENWLCWTRSTAVFRSNLSHGIKRWRYTRLHISANDISHNTYTLHVFILLICEMWVECVQFMCNIAMWALPPANESWFGHASKRCIPWFLILDSQIPKCKAGLAGTMTPGPKSTRFTVGKRFLVIWLIAFLLALIK